MKHIIVLITYVLRCESTDEDISWLDFMIEFGKLIFLFLFYNRLHVIVSVLALIVEDWRFEPMCGQFKD